MEREEFEKLVKDLNELQIVQTDDEVKYDLLNCKYKEVFKKAEVACLNTYLDKFRWYETSIDVFCISGFYLGVEHVCTIYQEATGLEDIDYSLNFVEMERVIQPTYVIK